MWSLKNGPKDTCKRFDVFFNPFICWSLVQSIYFNNINEKNKRERVVSNGVINSSCKSTNISQKPLHFQLVCYLFSHRKISFSANKPYRNEERHFCRHDDPFQMKKQNSSAASHTDTERETKLYIKYNINYEKPICFFCIKQKSRLNKKNSIKYSKLIFFHPIKYIHLRSSLERKKYIFSRSLYETNEFLLFTCVVARQRWRGVNQEMRSVCIIDGVNRKGGVL